MTILTRRTALTAGLLATLGLGDHPAAPSAETAPNPLEDPRTRIAHLFRRAGFGATPEELDRYQATGFETAVEELLAFDQVPDPAEERAAALRLDIAKPNEIKRWWIVRMVHTTRPLQEKMVLFWHGHLTSGLSKVGGYPQLMVTQNELFRGHACGNYAQLLKDVSKDGAMLFWLDGRGSRKKHPNENYARELMELFTMGEGHYTEKDVREAARAFTGWQVERLTGNVSFNRGAHDTGVKTVLGQSGRFSGDDVVDILVQQPATAYHLARRLFTYFAYPNPEPEIVESLANTYFESGFNVGAMVRQILLSDAFSSAKAYRAIVRPPVDLVVGALRSLGLETDGTAIPGALQAMGQDIFNPPNPAGWPGGPAWISSATWLARVNFINAVVSRRRSANTSAVDLTGIARSVEDPMGLLRLLSRHLLDGGLPQPVEQYAWAEPALALTSVALNRKGRGVLYLLMASPEYQLM